MNNIQFYLDCLNKLPAIIDCGYFGFYLAKIGDSKEVKFNKKFTKTPQVVIGQAKYNNATNEYTVVQSYNITKDSFFVNVTACVTQNYSPSFSWIAIGN